MISTHIEFPSPLLTADIREAKKSVFFLHNEKLSISWKEHLDEHC